MRLYSYFDTFELDNIRGGVGKLFFGFFASLFSFRRTLAAARAAFADTVPSVVLDRRSKGELGAYYGRAVAERLPFLRDYLLGGALAEAGLIDPSLDARLTREHLLWRGGHSELLSLAQTEAWVRRWRDRLAARAA